MIHVYLDTTGWVSQIKSAFPAILFDICNEHTEALTHRLQHVHEVSRIALETRRANGVFQLFYRCTRRNRSFLVQYGFCSDSNCSESNKLVSNSQNNLACRHSVSWKVLPKLTLCWNDPTWFPSKIARLKFSGPYSDDPWQRVMLSVLTKIANDSLARAKKNHVTVIAWYFYYVWKCGSLGASGPDLDVIGKGHVT